MALKSHYVKVVDATTHKTVFERMFFAAPDMNRYLKEEKLNEKYPEPTYYIVKEYY